MTKDDKKVTRYLCVFFQSLACNRRVGPLARTRIPQDMGVDLD